MFLDSITARALKIPFNAAFKHASAERHVTQALWVEAVARDGTTGFGEGCPREYVTAESQQTAQAFVAMHKAEWLSAVRDTETLINWIAQHQSDVDANPSAWTAVEIALLDLLGKSAGRSVEAMLGLPELAGRFLYTAVLGDASIDKFETQLKHYLRAGFRDFKIKLSGERMRDQAKVRALLSAGIAAQSVRADANNLWSDADSAIRDLAALEFPFIALEEPLRAGDYDGMHRIAVTLGTNIILDESMLRVEQLGRLGNSVDRWIANVRVSKMGGLMRSLEFLRAARHLGLRVILGAHVGETSVLTRAALTVANVARDILFAQEGAFGTHLLACDVIEAPLMFGPGGILDPVELGIRSDSGLGLPVSRAALQKIVDGEASA